MHLVNYIGERAAGLHVSIRAAPLVNDRMKLITFQSLDNWTHVDMLCSMHTCINSSFARYEVTCKLLCSQRALGQRAAIKIVF